MGIYYLDPPFRTNWGVILPVSQGLHKQAHILRHILHGAETRKPVWGIGKNLARLDWPKSPRNAHTSSP